ncbi:hypothetical protein CLOP_g14877 [Closterium sp. NIES-67]|nr:hypothetical protein CLOP_g14877 [Closterium sp. NIES-67]
MRYGDALRSLGLAHGAHRDEVRSAFHQLAKRTHPDVVPPGMRGKAEAEFKKILEAYHLLSSRPAKYHPMRRRPSPSSPSSMHTTTSTAAAAGAAGMAARMAAGMGGGPGSVVPRGSLSHHGLVALPFVLLVLGTVSLGTSCLVYSYKKATKDSKSRNPFLP